MLLLSFAVAISLEMPLSDEVNTSYQGTFVSQDDLVSWIKKNFLKEGISEKERQELLTLISTLPSQTLPGLIKMLNQKSDMERIHFFKKLLHEQGAYSRRCAVKVPPELKVVGPRKYVDKKKDLDEDEAFRIWLLGEIEKFYQMSKK